VQVYGNGGSATLTNVLTLQATGVPHFVVDLVSPGIVGYHMPSTFYAVYTNTGTASMPAPLVIFTMTQNGKQYGFLTLDSSLAGQSFWTSNEQSGFSHSVQFLASGAIPGLLQPGESGRISVYYAGWKQDTSLYGTGLYGWDSSRHPMTFSLNTIAADNAMPIDWAAYSANSMPGEGWASLLGKIETLFGNTWGSYVSALDQLANSLSVVANPAYDASQLFKIALEQASGFGGSRISGRVHDITANQPVTNTQVVASQRLSSGLAVVRQTQTDSTGQFIFADLPPGNYLLSVQNYLSPSPHDYALTNKSNLAGIVLDVAPIVAPVSPTALTAHTNDANPSLTIDSMGTTHLVWNRGAEIWHAYFDGTNWLATGSVPGAAGVDPILVASSNLVDGTRAGVMVAWRGMSSNGYALYYSVITNDLKSAASWPASSPVLLSNGETNYPDLDNKGLALVITPNGHVVAVWQKNRTAAVDDADLYYGNVPVSAAALNWPSNVVSVRQGAQSKLGEDCFSMGWKMGGFTIPDWVPVVGGVYRVNLESVKACKDYKPDCTASLSIGGGGSLDTPVVTFNASEVGGKAKYDTDPDACGYVFDSAELSFKIGAEVSIPAYAWKFGPVQAGLFSTWGISAGGEGTWTAATFPSWLPDDFKATISGSVGIKGVGFIKIPVIGMPKITLAGKTTLTGKYNGNWSGTLEEELSGEFKYKTFSGMWSHKWSVDFGGKSVPFAPKDGGPDWTLTLSPMIGTSNVYGGLPVMANIGSNVVQDGEPALAVTPAGTVLLAWIEDSDDPQTWLGSHVLVASLTNGGWTPPLEVPKSRGFNSDVRIIRDSLGNPLLVWTMAPSSRVSLTNTSDEVLGAVSSNSVVFSSYVGAKWSAASNVAVLPGTEDNVTLGKTADGRILAAWVNDTFDTNGVDTSVIYAAIWDGTNWSAPALVAASPVSGRIAVSVVSGSTTLFWTQDFVNTNAVDELSIYSSSLDPNKGHWSVPQAFTAGNSFVQAGVPKTMSGATPKDLVTFFLGNPPTNCCSRPPTNAPPPPPPPPCEDCTTNTVTVPGPQDPNAKIGLVGYGPLGYVAVDSVLPYTIYFENSTNATAPAQQVFVWDYLSTNLDWSTFELSGIGFGSVYVSIPPLSDYFATNVLAAYNGVAIEVQMEAGIDFASGKVFANFATLDPATHLPPPVNIGFLPPDDGTGIGMGYVSYFISPKPHPPSGTQITNVAYIQFDENPVIATDQVNDEDPAQGIDTNKVCLITIDAGAPTSQVLPLPAVETNLQFTVSWTGADDTNGSGIRDYIIYYSTNGVTFNVWLANTTNTSATFTGYPGMTNYFYSIAEDHVGYVENKATLVEAQTFVIAPSAEVLSQVLNINMDRQTGLFYQQVIVRNPGPVTITGLRFTATNLPAISVTNPVTLMSATGTNGQGAPYVDYAGSLAPNSTNTFTLSYYSRVRKAPIGVGVMVETVSIATPTNSTGTTFAAKAPFMRPDGKLAFEFSTLQGRTYIIKYSSDMVTWKQALTHVTGTGAAVIWVDAGPPDTDAIASGSRFYRVLLLSQ